MYPYLRKGEREMNYSVSILLYVIVISGVCFAAEQPGQKMESTVVAEPAAAVAAPTALRLKIVQVGFQLNWSLSPHDPGIVTGYELVRADRFTGPFDPVATIDKGSSQYTDASALPEIIYYYKVRAVAGKDYSPYSNTVVGER